MGVGVLVLVGVIVIVGVIDGVGVSVGVGQGYEPVQSVQFGKYPTEEFQYNVIGPGVLLCII